MVLDDNLALHRWHTSIGPDKRLLKSCRVTPAWPMTLAPVESHIHEHRTRLQAYKKVMLPEEAPILLEPPVLLL